MSSSSSSSSTPDQRREQEAPEFIRLEQEAPEFIKDPADGKFKVKNTRTGKLEPAWKHLHLDAGDDFALYVRRCGDCAPFPYDPKNECQVEHSTLWNQRKLCIMIFKPREGTGRIDRDDDPEHVPKVWSTCRVASWVEISNVPKNGGIAYMEWVLRVGFETTGLEYRPGTVVRFKGLVQLQELNGRIGVISDTKLTKNKRYRVIIMDFEHKRAKKIGVRPINMERAVSMGFIIERISVQGGGLLMPLPQEKFAPEPQRLSFQWMERISEEKPWYHISNPNTSWRDDPVTPDEDLVAMYESEMAECLRHDDEASKIKTLEVIVDDLKTSLHQLTRNGNMTGMREARELLRMQPVPIALSALKESIPHSQNFHLLDVIAHYIGEMADQGAPTSPTVVEASERLGLDLEAEFHNQPGFLFVEFVGVLQALYKAKEYRHVKKTMSDMAQRGNSMIWQEHVEPVALKLYSCSALGDSTPHFASALNGFNIPGQLSNESLTGTCGDVPPFECKFNAQYDPQKFASIGGSQDCAACRRTCLVTYWCRICDEVPYCCSACADRHWEKGHKIVCCSKDGKYVGLCANCSKPAILGCPYCIFTYYCGSDCQEKHWFSGGHKDTCPKKPMASPPKEN